MENKKKIEKQMKVGKEILEVFKKNEIKPSEMVEILDNLKLAVSVSIVEVIFKHKNK